MSNFETAFENVIGLEGGYSNDPDDPGGETKWGISKRSYPHLNIAALTLEEAKQIYWLDFWNRMLLNMILDNDIAEELFEQGVNLGRNQAVIHAQMAVGMVGRAVEVDGWIGPQTIGALNGIRADRKFPLMKCLNGYQFMRYLTIVENNPKQKKFFVGWLRRVALAEEGD